MNYPAYCFLNAPAASHSAPTDLWRLRAPHCFNF